ncbi:unnamed protein product [Moneuplotes crassus]|uniref:Uncharacterized protein n=1 Tax=Euplotes crassus TaxID=5936 RepID=A0AAD1U9B2_EUPCR|nr:unnamed protein product [Moneuplotes crassus]
MEPHPYQKSYTPERSRSVIKNAHYWKNSSWKTLSQDTDSNSKIYSNQIFLQNSQNRNAARKNATFTTPYGRFAKTPSMIRNSSSQPPGCHHPTHPKHTPTQSQHLSKNLENEFESMLELKCKRRKKTTQDKRSMSVHRIDDKLINEIIDFTRNLKPTKIPVRKFPKSLPKLRPNLQNNTRNDSINYSIDHPEESPIINKQNPQILIMPNVVQTDLPDPKTLISQLKKRNHAALHSQKQIPPFPIPDPLKSQEAAHKRLLTSQDLLDIPKPDNTIEARLEKFLEQLDSVTEEMYFTLPQTCTKKNRKRSYMNRTTGKEGILKGRKRFSQLGNELSVNVNMCEEVENMLEMEKNRRHSTQINKDSFLIRRKSFNPDLVNRLNSFDPNIHLTSKLTRKKTSQLSIDATFSKTSNLKSHTYKAPNSPHRQKTLKPTKILLSKAATNLHRAKNSLPSHDQSNTGKRQEVIGDKEQKVKVEMGSKEWRRKVQKNRKQMMQMKRKWEEEKKQLNQIDFSQGSEPPLQSIDDQDSQKSKAHNGILLTENIFTGEAHDAEYAQMADHEQDIRKNRAEKGANQEINDTKMLEAELTSEVNAKKQFYQVAKNVLNSGMLDKFLGVKFSKTEKKKYTKNNVKNKLAQMKFIQKCKEENVLAVPVINKLKEKKLILENYRMNEGLAKALEAAIEELAEYIEVIALKSNDMNDASLSKIINGVSSNPYMKTLKIENNKLDEECAKSLKALLCEFDEKLGRRKKSHIESISVHDCFMRPINIEIFTSSLPDNRTIKELVLTTVKLNSLSTKNICTFISENYSLRKLDLSWNEIFMSDLGNLTESIGNVTHIQYLSLAAVPFSGPNNTKMATHLSTILRKSLVHCDLSGCNLSHECCLILAKAMRYSRTLVAIHLSANNMSSYTKEEMMDVFTEKSSEIERTETLSNLPSKVQNSPSNDYKLKVSMQRQRRMQRTSINKNNAGVKETIDDRVIFTRILGHIEIKGSHRWKLTKKCWICAKWNYTVFIANKRVMDKLMNKNFDTLKYKQAIENARNNEEMTVISSTPEISGSFTSWKPIKMMPILDYCEYVSRNGLPSTRFYIEADGSMYNKLARAFTRDIQLIMKKKFCLRKVEEPTVYKIRDDIISQKKVIEEEERKREEELYTTKLVKKKSIKKKKNDTNPNPSLTLKDKAGLEHEENNQGSFEPEEERFGFERWTAIAKKFFDTEKAIEVFNLCDIFELHYQSNSRTIKSEKSNSHDEEYYIYADYLPPEKHEFCIDLNPTRSAEDNLYHFSFVVPFRDSEHKVKEKRVKKRMVLHKFIKKNSVFRAWKEDNQDRLSRAFELDMHHSKIAKFTGTKDVYEEVTDVLYKHTRKIKDLFTYGIGNSSFPSISWLDFCDMCKTWKIVDKNLKFSTIDRVFIVTNFEEVEQEDNPDRDLCRYEFYEIIARLAREKYYNTKIYSSLAEATERFLEDIFDRCDHYWSWQKWREEKLWTYRVDQLFKANLPQLQKIYKSYHNHGKKWMDLDDVTDLITRAMPEIVNTTEKANNEESKLNEKFKSKSKVGKDEDDSLKPKNIITLSYCYSKMTVIDEMGGDKDNYDRLQFVEFLEFIGRIANTIDSPIPSSLTSPSTHSSSHHLGPKLCTKIFKVLSKIFSLYNTTPLPAQSHLEVYSESDSEPYKS